MQHTMTNPISDPMAKTTANPMAKTTANPMTYNPIIKSRSRLEQQD